MPLSKKYEDILKSLSPNERAILSYLISGNIEDIEKKTGLDRTSILRSLEFLSNKGIVKLNIESKKIVSLDTNGILYMKVGLPERRLLNIFSHTLAISLKEAKEKSKLTDNEFKAALGVLKRKMFIKVERGIMILQAKKEEITKKMLEESFLERLPCEIAKLQPQDRYALEQLKGRKDIIKVEDIKKFNFELTPLGKKLIKIEIDVPLIETLTTEMLKKGTWKGREFRKYDIVSKVPKIYGGKKHFVNQAIEYARKIWIEMGFKEMTGTFIQTSFWNFDVLFTPQDHPVRELQDTFYIKQIYGRLPNKELVNKISILHEGNANYSQGWKYKWNEEEARRVVLRTHTTCLSVRTLYNISKLKNKQGKFFAIGKCFRNETVDSSHLFEFNQTEGIVIDTTANFRHLLGYLKEFLIRMGFKKIRFRPHFFPYTEPSVEADVYNEKTKKWVEVLGAGIFRPEVVIPLFDEYIPVLAWGMGFDRMIAEHYNINDLRELYENNITKLRKTKIWIK